MCARSSSSSCLGGCVESIYQENVCCRAYLRSSGIIEIHLVVQEMSTRSSFAALGRYTQLATTIMANAAKARLRGLEC